MREKTPIDTASLRYKPFDHVTFQGGAMGAKNFIINGFVVGYSGSKDNPYVFMPYGKDFPDKCGLIVAREAELHPQTKGGANVIPLDGRQTAKTNSRAKT